MDVFSERLREERKFRGYSQCVMAEKLGITQGTYKGYELIGEKNGRTPPLDMIRKIIKILEISADYLLGLED
ncbi:MAG: helix-turn-helix domain-containing protein [Firmicutes bacterium]|nr:helix-turn-helix domain-containing protein [Bacillota bacterium]